MAPFEFLGPYRIGEPIGRGGMGSVFKATHEKTGDVVAVKVIAASVSDDVRFRRRFSTEIETLKKLKHPNIVSLIGHGEQHGQLFYSMELVVGESLQQRLRREKRLPWPVLLDISIEICNALKHAHNFGVVHRDLKPANLLITTDGTPKLVDFGIAKLFGNSEQTAMGSVLGTADFMAPEQACDGPISPRTDLYALGNVMYACLAGRAPFAGRSMNRIIESLKNENPAPLDLIVPDVPDEITKLIHDLLQKMPDDRPPTALAVMNRMKAIRAGLERQMSSEAITRIADGQTRIKDQPSSADGPTHVEKSLPKARTLASNEIEQTGENLSRHDLTIEASAVDRNPLARKAGHDSDLAVPSSSRKEHSARPLIETAVSFASSAANDVIQEPPATHFNTVDDHDRRKSTWEINEDSTRTNHVWQILSIAAMVSALIGATGLFLWSMRKPGADELYAMILDSQQQEDSVSMRTQVDQFKRLYPADPRVNEVVPFLQEQDSSRVMRRLRLAVVREGGDEHLAAHEQIFLEAMRDLDRDPAKSQAMFRDWLDVYDPPGSNQHYEKSSELNYMIRAARQELQRLSTKPLPPADVRANELISRIQWAEDALDPKSQEKLLRGIVSLYSDKPWAKPALQLAQSLLEKPKGTPAEK